MPHDAFPPASGPSSGATAQRRADPEGSGEALQRAGRLQEAEQAYRAVLADNPDDARTLSNYGGLLCTLGAFDAAYELLARAVALDPALTDGWSNFGNVLLQTQRYDEAIAAYRNCLQRNPVHPLALSNLGLALDHRGEHELAQKFHQVAVALTPENAQTRTNHALSLLAQGKYLEGFREYEWRWTTFDSRRNAMSAPLWNGEDFRGRTLLIHTEGGFGDMIQFSRFFPCAAERGGRTLIRARRELLTLFRHSFPDQTFVSEEDEIPPHDLQCPALSLPRALGTTLTTIPSAGGFLRADPDKMSFWRGLLQDDAMKDGRRVPSLRVGLVWAGAPHREIRAAELADRRRSTDLATFAPLADAAPDAVFYSLQLGERAGQAGEPPAGMRLIDHTSLLRDFSDTAALIGTLDLVISVDTSTAHIAAGLGKPVWMLSRYDQCWRWLSGRTDSPWYDSLRLYQQTRPLDWSDPMHRVRADLCALVETRPSVTAPGRSA
ncbi:tetratricopeptide repeat-containing glycosyltransferase family protein [Nguyenibacter sp. L1]|uniref:tetratricopeptide repeat-containing glycosyltransferase family protein n=1 Tax=Nguyenibacter sp. L1 TaxID=3049350 RepID=UPI002B495F53|nr:tetratricopeptide repeat-containing glycosyltransferase family protein [Nguyenibacter sp. L1]WRH89686.1 tetratricopeptide repeat-containing glycosyltransferase family protein [Nguyenibacter sp. L1]